MQNKTLEDFMISINMSLNDSFNSIQHYKKITTLQHSFCLLHMLLRRLEIKYIGT